MEGISNPRENHGPGMNIANGILVPLAGILLAMRLLGKYRGRRGLWWDDYILVAAWICTIASAATVGRSIALGFGHHMADIPPQNLPTIALLGNVVTTISIAAVIWSKTSFAVTLLRITDGYYRAFVWFAIISTNVFMWAGALVTWVRCSPLSKTWLVTESGTCWPQGPTVGYDIFSGVWSGVMDIALALLPWRLIWNLQMKRKEKIGVGLAMNMGIFAGATAFAKSAALLSIGGSDFTYEGDELVIWSTAEATVTIMAASIPVLRVFIREVRLSFSGHSKNPSGARSATHRQSGNSAILAGMRHLSNDDSHTITTIISAGGGAGRDRNSSASSFDAGLGGGGGEGAAAGPGMAAGIGNPLDRQRSIFTPRRTSNAGVGGGVGGGGERSNSGSKIILTSEVVLEYHDRGASDMGDLRQEMARIGEGGGRGRGQERGGEQGREQERWGGQGRGQERGGEQERERDMV